MYIRIHYAYTILYINLFVIFLVNIIHDNTLCKIIIIIVFSNLSQTTRISIEILGIRSTGIRLYRQATNFRQTVHFPR